MNNVIDKYISENTLLEIEVTYDIGTYDRERGYYIYFTKYSVLKYSNRAISKSITQMDRENFVIKLEPAKRFSQKKFYKYCEILKDNKDMLLRIYQNYLVNKEVDISFIKELFK